MADLTQEFFEREFSESDGDSLKALLEESPEAVLRFERLLESHYLATGLPSPELPPSLQSLPFKPGGWGAFGAWKLLSVLAAAGLAFVAWKYWPSSQTLAIQPAPVPAAMSQAPAPVIANPRPAQAVLPPTVEPQPAGPMAEGKELSVVVGTQEKTLVTVRILGQGGREIRDLYTGFVQPGHWSFKWDGELSDGNPAPAGDYQIDVQSG
ncbi:MAG TPA: FlgD immunoglobulin-like domain containing protein, partial [bacterium]|nr:FlgD immunoglobulin-like domain containing protein [bacterium]